MTARATMFVGVMGIIAITLEAGALFVAATIMAPRVAIRPAVMAVIVASSFVAAVITTLVAVITAIFFVIAAVRFTAKVSTGAVFRLMIARWATSVVSTAVVCWLLLATIRL